MDYFRYDMPRVSSAVADAVYSQLLDDYKPEDLDWVCAAQWTGPVTVRLEDIDFSNAQDWMAIDDTEKVDDFAEMIDDGHRKPIILVDTPDGSMCKVVDGHHRALAYRKLNRPAVAFVARVGSNEGPWDLMHSEQLKSGPPSQ